MIISFQDHQRSLPQPEFPVPTPQPFQPHPHPVGTLYRHRKLLLRRVARLPVGVQMLPGAALSDQQVTPDYYQILPLQAVRLWSHGQRRFLEIKAGSATLVYEPESAIEQPVLELPPGIYQLGSEEKYGCDNYQHCYRH